MKTLKLMIVVGLSLVGSFVLASRGGFAGAQHAMAMIRIKLDVQEPMVPEVQQPLIARAPESISMETPVIASVSHLQSTPSSTTCSSIKKFFTACCLTFHKLAHKKCS